MSYNSLITADSKPADYSSTNSLLVGGFIEPFFCSPKICSRDLSASLQCSQQLWQFITLGSETALWFQKSARWVTFYYSYNVVGNISAAIIATQSSFRPLPLAISLLTSEFSSGQTVESITSTNAIYSSLYGIPRYYGKMSPVTICYITPIRFTTRSPQITDTGTSCF